MKQTSLHYTIVRPGGLTKEAGTGTIQVGETVERGSIPREDVAKTMIAAIEEPNARYQAFEMISGDTPIETALKMLTKLNMSVIPKSRFTGRMTAFRLKL